MDSRPDKIFVYGTLRRGYDLHSELKKLGARYLGNGQVLGMLFDLGEYPGLLRVGNKDEKVEGELYELPNPKEQLPTLDKIEEFDAKRPAKSLFLRKRATVKLEKGGRTRAWVYLLPRRPRRARVIEGGNYADFRRQVTLIR